MLNVVVNQNQDYGLVVSSRVVAKGLNKEHKNVLRDLEGMLKSEPTPQGLIIPSFYTNKQNKQQYKEYLLTKKGFILYMFNIQGYLDFKLAYINKFEEMEKQLATHPQMDYFLNKIRIWENAIESSVDTLRDYRIEAQKLLKKEPEKSMTMQEYAKKLNTIGVKKMYIYLRENGYIEHNSLRPTEKALKKGLFSLEEKEWDYKNGKKVLSFKSRITPKGQKYFAGIFKNKQLTLV